MTKKEQYGREVDKPILPSLVLNPSGDFGLDDANSTARQLWRFPNLAPGLADMLYEPIYQDSHISLNDENIPDFTGVRYRDGSRDIIEIKQPFIPIFRGDNLFRSEFNQSWDQVERYLDFIT